MIRTTLTTGAVLLAVVACTDMGAPVRGGGPAGGTGAAGDSDTTYRTFMRQRERAGTPFSVPPETQGAPLAAPMRADAPPLAAAAGADTDDTPPAQTAPTRITRDTAPAPPDGERLRPPQDGPRFGVPALADEVPLVRVTPDTAAADNGPDLVAYALQTTHSVGTQRYTRRHPLRWRVWERNCLQFADQNSAQEAFLAAGGPESDRQNLDPDGDGFACWWDPEPIRRAMRAAGD